MEQGKFRWRLGHIIEAIERIEDHLSGETKEIFLSNYDLQCVIVRQFEIIGEAIRAMDDDVYKRYPEVDWYKAMGMRNIFIHDYFGINCRSLWKTAKTEIPDLKVKVSKIFGDLKAQKLL